MFRSVRLTLGVAAVLAVAAGEARAQYYPGYGGYGWGGWGAGGATIGGDVARGLGYYNIGAGVYNEKTAIANSINADTVMRWNQYMWLSQQEANRREYIRMARRMQRDSSASDQIYQRIRDNPTERDIHNGDALNVILDQVTDPRIHSSALRMAKANIPGDVIDDIPFEHASEAVTVSLHQLTKNNWPEALQGDRYAPDRALWEQAIAAALDEEDKTEKISPQTLDRIRSAATAIRLKFDANPPTDRDDLVEGRNYIKTMLGLSRMLKSPNIEKVIGELEKHPKTTLGSLLGFMHTYNLRFGPATTPEQQQIYETLYPQMAAHRDQVYKDSGIDLSKPPKAPQKPIDFFQGMHLDHLDGQQNPTK